MTSIEEICLQELELLKKIADEAPYFEDQTQGWNRKQKGKTVIYEQTITYAGSTQSVELAFEKMVQVNLITLVWNDGTSKDYYIRAYPARSAYYATVDYATSSTDTDTIIQTGNEYDLMPGAKLQFYFENYTAGKICQITVHTEEL